jgi:hypothetical protein
VQVLQTNTNDFLTTTKSDDRVEQESNFHYTRGLCGVPTGWELILPEIVACSLPTPLPPSPQPYTPTLAIYSTLKVINHLPPKCSKRVISPWQRLKYGAFALYATPPSPAPTSRTRFEMDNKQKIVLNEVGWADSTDLLLLIMQIYRSSLPVANMYTLF